MRWVVPLARKFRNTVNVSWWIPVKGIFIKASELFIKPKLTYLWIVWFYIKNSITIKHSIKFFTIFQFRNFNLLRLRRTIEQLFPFTLEDLFNWTIGERFMFTMPFPTVPMKPILNLKLIQKIKILIQNIIHAVDRLIEWAFPYEIETLFDLTIEERFKCADQGGLIAPALNVGASLQLQVQAR